MTHLVTEQPARTSRGYRAARGPAASRQRPLTGWVFRADGHDQEIDLTDDGLPRLNSKALLWIDLEAEDEAGLEAAAELLELPQELVDRLGSSEARPSLADYEELIHVRVVEVARGDDPSPLPMDAVAGRNWLLTRHGSQGGYVESFRNAFKGETGLGRLDSLSFLAALLDHFLGHYFAATERVEEQIESFDQRAMQAQISAGEEELAKIVMLRRTLATLRRVLVLHREPYARLADPDLTSLASQESADRARALLVRLERAVDGIESARQMVAGSFEIMMARTSQRTNDTMKLLTLISAALLPSAVIAGVLGMNFKQSFFELSYLFWLAVALMAALMVTVVLIARWRKWL
jgi:magnesium transporter